MPAAPAVRAAVERARKAVVIALVIGVVVVPGAVAIAMLATGHAR